MGAWPLECRSPMDCILAVFGGWIGRMRKTGRNIPAMDVDGLSRSSVCVCLRGSISGGTGCCPNAEGPRENLPLNSDIEAELLPHSGVRAFLTHSHLSNFTTAEVTTLSNGKLSPPSSSSKSRV